MFSGSSSYLVVHTYVIGFINEMGDMFFSVLSWLHFSKVQSSYMEFCFRINAYMLRYNGTAFRQNWSKTILRLVLMPRGKQILYKKGAEGSLCAL